MNTIETKLDAYYTERRELNQRLMAELHELSFSIHGCELEAVQELQWYNSLHTLFVQRVSVEEVITELERML